MNLERISDREFVADEIGDTIVHVPHFQARKIPGKPDKLMVFDTFLEKDRLGVLDGAYAFTRDDIKQIVAGLQAWLDGQS